MDILRFFAGLRTPFLDRLFLIITLFGEELVILCLICLVFWCVDKELGYRIGVTFFLSGLLVQALKITFRIDRPWVTDKSFNPVEGSVEASTGYSFPSGHTQGAAGLYAPVGLYAKRLWLSIACFALLGLVGLSRIYLGVHMPKDVIVSLVMTIVIAVGIHFLLGRCATKKANLILSAFMFVFSAGVLAYSMALHGGGLITLDYVSDCSKAAAVGIGFSVGFFIERTYINFDTKTDRLYKQPIKLIVGLAGALAIKEGLKLIIGAEPVADVFRYMLLALWVIVFYPLIIKAFQKRKIREGEPR